MPTLKDVRELIKLTTDTNLHSLIDRARDTREIRMILEARNPRASFGISPAAASLPAAGSNGFYLKLVDSGANKIGVIKAIREIAHLGLKEAKDIADLTASPFIFRNQDPARVRAGYKLIEDAGGFATYGPES